MSKVIIAYKEGRLEDFDRLVKEWFVAMDTNNNGEVDKSEVRKFMHIFCDLDSDEEVDSETVESNA